MWEGETLSYQPFIWCISRIELFRAALYLIINKYLFKTRDYEATITAGNL